MDFDDECADEELQLAGNDHDDPPQQEDASRRKRRRFTSNSGSGRDAVKTCFVASCSETCAKGKKWCATHNRFYDSMSYHAKKNKETEIFNQVMGDALEADRAFKRFMDDNPDQGRWSRKKFIEWSQFKKEHSLSLVHTDRRGAKPFEKCQWIQRGLNKMGWSKQQCINEWEKQLKDASVKRDTLGIDGSLRLWIGVVEMKAVDTQRTGPTRYGVFDTKTSYIILSY